MGKYAVGRADFDKFYLLTVILPIPPSLLSSGKIIMPSFRQIFVSRTKPPKGGFFILSKKKLMQIKLFFMVYVTMYIVRNNAQLNYR